jgi:Lon protease-like protein
VADLMPMFPLGIVAFPGEKLNLHIFEPRYKQLIGEVEAQDLHFGIAPYFEGKDLLYATAMKLEKIVKRYEDGKIDISLRGLHVVKILDFFPKHPTKLYPCAEIEPLSFDINLNIEANRKIVSMLNELYKTMRIYNIHLQSAESFLTSDVGHKVGFTTDQELEFLLINNEYDRAKYMLKHLMDFVPQALNMEKLRKKAELNGHFQHVVPPF